MNKEEQKLFDDYAKHYHQIHQKEKQKRDLEFWQKRITRCQTFEQLLSLELTIVNATNWDTFIRLKRFINQNMSYLIQKNYNEKPKTLKEKIKNLFK